MLILLFFFNDTATTEIYTLSLHDALPIWLEAPACELLEPGGRLLQAEEPLRRQDDERTGPLVQRLAPQQMEVLSRGRAEIGEHTSELQSPCNLVCRLLLEKKKHNAHILTT